MDKKGFKVGDRVKLKNPRDFSHLGSMILTIMEFDSKFVLVNWGCAETFPLYPNEIAHAVRVGEQLMFAFMRTSD